MSFVKTKKYYIVTYITHRNLDAKSQLPFYLLNWVQIADTYQAKIVHALALKVDFYTPVKLNKWDLFFLSS